MKARILFALTVVVTLVGPVLGAVRRVEQRTFAVQPGATVKIDTYRGLINVLPDGGDEVRITVAMELASDKTELAQNVLDGFELTSTQSGNELSLLARNPRDGSVRYEWSKLPRPGIEITVHVPESCNLDLLTSDGSLTVGNLRGSIRARADVGAIFFRRIEGNIDARTRTGDVIVSRCSGAVDLRSVQGNIRIGTVGGRALLETVSGDIEVLSAYAAVTAETEDGNVTAGFAEVSSDSKIKTAVGNIHARVNPAQAFSLQASSTWGKVTSKFTQDAVKGFRFGRSKVADRHNGGGPLINLKASGGNVLVEPGEPLFQLSPSSEG